jgi:serine/threonine protein kinase
MLTDEKLKRDLLERGLLTQEQVDECAREGAEDVRQGRTQRLFTQILLEKGYVSPQTLQSFLKPPTAPTVAPEPRLPQDVQDALKEPANLAGKYVKLEQLGRGGMGVVYRAWDSDLKRYVAIKYLEGAAPEEIKRFQREAQLAASLKHPNIAQIYELGTHNERHYISMELIRGVTLDRYVGQLGDRQAMEILRQVCDALGYAHSKGIVHRDIKPQNIMLESAPGGSSPHVYVMDFGLAKPMQVDSSLSMSGIIMGTPQYMSPEQADGDPKKLDHRSDIYSMGATVYHLLSGQPAVPGATPMQIVMNLPTAEPAPLRRIRPEVHRDVEVMVHKCLEKSRDRRYFSAKDLQRDVELFLSGQPIEARSPSLVFILGKGIRRHRAKLFVAVTLGLAILIGGGLFVRSRLQAQEIVDRARRNKEEADRLYRASAALLQRPLKSISAEARADRKKNIDEAIAGLDRAIGLDGSDPLYYMARAQARLMQSQQARAVQDYTSALALDPKLGDALWGRIICRFLQVGEGFDLTLELKGGRPQLGVTPFSPSMDRASIASDLQALERLGQLYSGKVKCGQGVLAFHDNKLNEAASRFAQAAKEEVLAEAHALLGYTALVRIQEEPRLPPPPLVAEMMDNFSRAIDLEPNTPIYYVLRCVGRAAAGHEPRFALADVDQAIQINPDDGDLYVIRAFLLAPDPKTRPEAWTWVEKAKQKEPENTRADIMTSYLQWLSDDTPGAIKTLDDAIRRHPDYGYLFYLRGLFELSEKNASQAEKDFAVYLSKLPEEQRPRAEGYIKGVKEFVRRAGELVPMTSPREMLESANRARDRGDWSTATALYRALLRRSDRGPRRPGRPEGKPDEETRRILAEAAVNLFKIHVERREITQAIGILESMLQKGWSDIDLLKKETAAHKRFWEDPRVVELLKKYGK